MGKPEAKTFAVVRQFGDELVIVDERHDVAHRLDAAGRGGLSVPPHDSCNSAHDWLLARMSG